MKIFYLSILTLCTIAHSDAADLPEAEAQLTTPREVTLEHIKNSVKKQQRPTTPSSVSGSVKGSYAGSWGGASSIVARHDVYTPVEAWDIDGVIAEYQKLRASYQQLLTITLQIDDRLSRFVGGVEKELLPVGGIDRGEANEDRLTSLKTAFKQLLKMYRTAQKLYDSKTGKVTVLESTIAELTEAQEALQATLATMAPRPTEFVGTDMSPARKAAIAADDVENSDVVAALRMENAKLQADAQAKSDENAKLQAVAQAKSDENARLQAENAALKAATKLATKPATNAGIKEPLLPKDGYTHLNDGSTGKPNKKDGCPSCSVQ
jgi:hypothetical protein